MKIEHLPQEIIVAVAHGHTSFLFSLLPSGLLHIQQNVYTGNALASTSFFFLSREKLVALLPLLQHLAETGKLPPEEDDA